ncbi:unnamed protein product [Didymodactylos carnosus]|uniref:Shisa N-terminal domain-containing protein n=1 Tax=Didymodactylos carnosus TaxID=1234261 RepID=A0A814F3U3_9BILA|nr:unnamed protein product [Didymodactylos carnosus]CAF1201811.1 unnamed protein product [Didymodactylos carnosus]CAF3747540.1 unnamed protein product [Didymodactylos carnosus]CAF4011694.1 unnamed protein product [Didymodactylos carnosus]
MTRAIMATTTPFSLPNTTPSTICGGYIDIHGTWQNGFACPIKHSIQLYCCGSDIFKHCCSDMLLSQSGLHLDDNSNKDHDLLNSNLLIKSYNRSMISTREFERFQSLFLPIFLSSSSILFLIGIALWFWLWRHKTFYSIEHDDELTNVGSHGGIRGETNINFQNRNDERRSTGNLVDFVRQNSINYQQSSHQSHLRNNIRTKNMLPRRQSNYTTIIDRIETIRQPTEV